MKNTISSLKQNRQKIFELAKRHGANNVRVFGSVAQNEANVLSDIDFLVDMNPDKSILDRIALRQDLETFLQQKIDVATEKSLHWYIRDRVINEAISL